MNVTNYLKTISQFNLLTKEEEQKLFKKVKSGDTEAREQAITANLRLAVNIAKKYMHTNVPFQDLVQEANAGLIKAIDRFDPEQDRRFSTYATFWIKQAVIRFLNDSKNFIRYPSYIIDSISKLSKFIQEYKNKNQKIPSVKSMSEFLQLSEKDIEKVLKLMSTSYVSLEEQSESGFVPKSCHKNVDEFLCEEIDSESIVDMVKKLRGREFDILVHRYGLFGNEKMTLEKVAEKLDLTRERVRQIQNSVIDKLRDRAKYI